MDVSRAYGYLAARCAAAARRCRSARGGEPSRLNFSTVTSARACATTFCTPSWIIFWRSSSCACSKVGGSARRALLHLDHVPAELGVHRRCEIWPGFSANAAAANSGTMSSFLKKPRSPPCARRRDPCCAAWRGRRNRAPFLSCGDDLLGLVLVGAPGCGGHAPPPRPACRRCPGRSGRCTASSVTCGPTSLRSSAVCSARSWRARHLPLHRRVLVQPGLAACSDQRLAVDQLVEQHRVERLRRHAAALRRAAPAPPRSRSLRWIGWPLTSATTGSRLPRPGLPAGRRAGGGAAGGGAVCGCASAGPQQHASASRHAQARPLADGTAWAILAQDRPDHGRSAPGATRRSRGTPAGPSLTPAGPRPI